MYFYTSKDTVDVAAPAFSVPFEYAEFGHRVMPCGLYHVKLVSDDDERACGAVSVDDSPDDYFLFAKRGTCRYVDKIRNMQTAGAAASIVVNSFATVHAMPSGEDDEGYDIRIPAVMVGMYFRGDAEQNEGELWQFLRENTFWVSAC